MLKISYLWSLLRKSNNILKHNHFGIATFLHGGIRIKKIIFVEHYAANRSSFSKFLQLNYFFLYVPT